MQKYKLADLLALDGIPRSTFYFHIKRLNKPDKYFEIKKVIKKYFIKIKEDMDIVVLH
nr:hypothetical protein [Clostridium perfringens]